MPAVTSLVERHPGVIDLAIHHRAGIQSYTVGAAKSLDAASAGTTPLCTLPRGTSFRSKSLQKSGRNRVEETQHGLTRVGLDLVDFASATVPGDPDICFFRVSETDMGGNNLGEGAILVVPPANFFRAGQILLILNGTAPGVAGRADNLPPAGSLEIDFPRFIDQLDVYNDGANSIAVSLMPGTQEFLIPAATSATLPVTGSSQVSIRGEEGVSAFRLHAVMVNGLQG